MEPQDLDLLVELAEPRLSPDGTTVAYVAARTSAADDARTSAIHLLDLRTGVDRAFTGGPRDTAPAWSPDGHRIVFLRRDGDEPAQVGVITVAGGEARMVTDEGDFPLGVREVAWTADGARLVVVGVEWRADLAELTDDERDEQPRRITELGYRYDTQGWLHDRVARVWVLDLDDGSATALTPDDHTVKHVVVDGERVLFQSARHPQRELGPGQSVWSVPLTGGALEEVTVPVEADSPFAVDRDGGLWLTSLADPFVWPSPTELLHVAADAPGGATPVTVGALDRDVRAPSRGPLVLDDGSVLVLVADRGAVQLRRVATDGTDSTLVGGARVVLDTDATADGRRVVFVATHPTDPGELWLLEDGEPRVLTAHNAELRERLLPVEHFTFERDGVEVDAWSVLPPGDGPAPLLLHIHGGPAAQYSHAFFDEFQVTAAAGYVTVGCNPRGSSGRGAAWSTAVVGAWTAEDSVDTLDLEACVEAALARYDRADPERVGVMGGSYGGYATARLLARSGRYRSAIVERALLNWLSFGGTSDIGAYFDRMFVGAQLPADADALWQASPVRTADRITTPTLVIHSLEDHRCPPEQGLQLFSLLRRHGVESELLLFPGESHELSRSGSPKHRLQRFEAVLDWHSKHL